MDIFHIEIRQREFEFSLGLPGNGAEIVLGCSEHLPRPFLGMDRLAHGNDEKQEPSRFPYHGTGPLSCRSDRHGGVGCPMPFAHAIPRPKPNAIQPPLDVVVGATLR